MITNEDRDEIAGRTLIKLGERVIIEEDTEMRVGRILIKGDLYIQGMLVIE